VRKTYIATAADFTASKKLQMGGHFLFWFFGYFSLRLNFDTFVVAVVTELWNKTIYA